MLKTLLAALGATSLIVIPSAVPPVPRILWNASASVPVGLYAIGPAGKLQVGELVAAMPPAPLARFLAERRYLPLGLPLLKHIAALPGQIVCRDGAKVRIDGVLRAAARERDRAGRPLPVWGGCIVLGPDQLFLLNDAPGSFDSRYFGPIGAATVVGRATPLWTDEEA
jgi:conjugative transfer signal peptidase TraF